MSRRRKSYKNKSRQSLRQKELLVMLVEGETEEQYINYLKYLFDFKIKIEIVTKSVLDQKLKNTISRIAERYKINAQELILVYDLENSIAEYNKFINSGRLIHENTFLTQPTIEFHFLLHFQEAQNKFLSAANCERMLRAHIPQYKKGKSFIWENNQVNKDLVLLAMERSITNFSSYDQQSFSTIGFLIQKFFHN